MSPKAKAKDEHKTKHNKKKQGKKKKQPPKPKHKAKQTKMLRQWSLWQKLPELYTHNSFVTTVALTGSGSDPHGTGTNVFGLSHWLLPALLSFFFWGSWYEGSNLCVNPGVTAKLTGCYTDPEEYDYPSVYNANTLRVLIVSSNILLC